MFKLCELVSLFNKLHPNKKMICWNERLILNYDPNYCSVYHIYGGYINCYIYGVEPSDLSSLKSLTSFCKTHKLKCDRIKNQFELNSGYDD